MILFPIFFVHVSCCGALHVSLCTPFTHSFAFNQISLFIVWTIENKMKFPECGHSARFSSLVLVVYYIRNVISLLFHFILLLYFLNKNSRCTKQWRKKSLVMTLTQTRWPLCRIWLETFLFVSKYSIRWVRRGYKFLVYNYDHTTLKKLLGFETDLSLPLSLSLTHSALFFSLCKIDTN